MSDDRELSGTSRVPPSASCLGISPAKAGGEKNQVSPSASCLGISPAKAGGEMTCAAVVLAAGEAVRMGVAKPAMPYGDTTLVGSVVTKAHEAGLDPVIVVTGFHGDEVAEAVGGSAEIARNPDPGRGNMSSLLVGLDAVGDVDAVVLLLSDMPGVEVTNITAVRDRMSAMGARFAWVRYDDGRGHPVAMTAAGCSEIAGLTGTKALWPFFDKLDAGSYCEVSVDGPRPLDVNSPEDYRMLTGGDGDILGS